MAYSRTTRGITVTVEPAFVEAQSEPENGAFFWAYTVEITNGSTEIVQLWSRHWKITDGDGRMQEVKGPGVVGEQPILAPGDSFRYTSGCPLPTPSGIMAGTYQMQSESGLRFEVLIPAFSLDSPYADRTLN